MPMKPDSGESRDAFMDRCMDHYVNDKDMDQDQAVAVCLSQYREKAELPPPKSGEPRSQYSVRVIQEIRKSDDGLSILEAVTEAGKAYDDFHIYREKADRLRDSRGRFATREQISHSPAFRERLQSIPKPADSFLTVEHGYEGRGQTALMSNSGEVTAPLTPTAKAEFDESQHPRDAHGRFASGGGGSESEPAKNHAKVISELRDLKREAERVSGSPDDVAAEHKAVMRHLATVPPEDLGRQMRMEGKRIQNAADFAEKDGRINPQIIRANKELASYLLNNKKV